MIKKVVFVISAAVFLLACGEDKGGKTAGIDAKKLFKTNCALCHGMDGKLGANGSKDLTASPLSKDDRIKIITNGKGAMASYKAILTKEEIEAVAEFTFSL